ncbi:MAG: hypothetical protein ABIC95_03880 [archaeon]
MEDSTLLRAALIGAIIGTLWLWVVMETSLLEEPDSDAGTYHSGDAVSISGTIVSLDESEKIVKFVVETKDSRWEVLAFKGSPDPIGIIDGDEVTVKGRIAFEDEKPMIIADSAAVRRVTSRP